MIRLEKFKKADFALYYKLVGNEDVMRMITERAIPFDEAKEKFDVTISNNGLYENLGNYKVIHNETNDFLGSAVLKADGDDLTEAEIGYMLLPENWGKGIGGKIAQMLISMAEKTPQIKRLCAVIDPNNVASRKILINNGFQSKKICTIDGLPGEILTRELTCYERN